MLRGTGEVIDFCLSLGFGFSSSTLYLAGLTVCWIAQGAGLLLSLFVSSAVPDALNPPLRTKGVGGQREKAGSVEHLSWNCFRMLVTSMNVTGLLCKCGAVGCGGVTCMTRDSSHHRVGGQTALPASRRIPAERHSSQWSQTLLPASRPVHGLLGYPSTSKTARASTLEVNVNFVLGRACDVPPG